jgi:hypothetical protein
VEGQHLARRELHTFAVPASEHGEAAVAQDAPGGAVTLNAHVRKLSSLPRTIR